MLCNLVSFCFFALCRNFDVQAMMMVPSWTARRVCSPPPGDAPPMKAWTSGNVAGTGTFRCTDCDYPISLDAVDELPTCPNCGGKEFVRASLFTTAQTSVVEIQTDVEDQSWLEELREGLQEPGHYLAYRTPGDDLVVFELQREWTRIGRSLAADVRF